VGGRVFVEVLEEDALLELIVYLDHFAPFQNHYALVQLVKDRLEFIAGFHSVFYFLKNFFVKSLLYLNEDLEANNAEKDCCPGVALRKGPDTSESLHQAEVCASTEYES
jgi:hypothetical protein